MAPHRLKSRMDLRREASGFQPPTLRFWVIAHTPTVLIDYLLEVLCSAVAIVLGPAFMTGYVASSTAQQLDQPVTNLLGTVLVVGGVVVLFGLARQKYGSTVPAGMFMLSGAFLAYGIAVSAYTPLRVGLVSLLLLLSLSALTAWKGFLLRSTFLLVSARPQLIDREE